MMVATTLCGDHARSVVALAAALVLAVIASPVLGAGSQDDTVVLERTGDHGDAWAVAVRSHDEPASANGNELWVRLRTNAPLHTSFASMGIMEIEPDAEGTWRLLRAGVGGTYQSEDRLLFTPVGEVETPTVNRTVGLTALSPQDDRLGLMWEHRWMEPGEWRYFVAWAAGSESSVFKVKGEGIDVVKLIEGEAYSLGNDELIQGGGLHARQGVAVPGAGAAGPAYLGGGATIVEDTGVTMETSAPLLGVFTEFHQRVVCGPGPGLGCTGAGSLVNDVAGEVWDGGSARLSLTTPDRGNVSNPWDHYWLTPQNLGSTWFQGSTLGSYSFTVDRFTDVSGPVYRDPALGTGVRMAGEQLLLSLAEISYPELGGLEET